MNEYNLTGFFICPFTAPLGSPSIDFHGLTYSTASYLGAAIAQLALRPPVSIAGRTYQVWDYAPTGNDFIKAFTAAHNRATAVHELTEEQYQASLLDLPLGFMGASAFRLWGTGSFGFDEQRRIEADGVDVIQFNKLVKTYLDLPVPDGH